MSQSHLTPAEIDEYTGTALPEHADDENPQPPVRPNAGGLGTGGPQSFDDLVLHHGEARGLADTARHSLQPDAPTTGAAREGHDLDTDPAVSAGLPRYEYAED